MSIFKNIESKVTFQPDAFTSTGDRLSVDANSIVEYYVY